MNTVCVISSGVADAKNWPRVLMRSGRPGVLNLSSGAVTGLRRATRNAMPNPSGSTACTRAVGVDAHGRDRARAPRRCASRSAADCTPKMASRCVAPGSIGCGSDGSSASRSTTVEPFLQLKTRRAVGRGAFREPEVGPEAAACGEVRDAEDDGIEIRYVHVSVLCAERALERDALDQRENLAGRRESSSSSRASRVILARKCSPSTSSSSSTFRLCVQSRSSGCARPSTLRMLSFSGRTVAIATSRA